MLSGTKDATARGFASSNEQIDTAHKHLFMGSENRTALIMQFQLFAVASSDGFLGNVERR
jgi:hypothetical protein